MTLGEKMKYGKKGFYESPIRNLEGLEMTIILTIFHIIIYWR